MFFLVETVSFSFSITTSSFHHSLVCLNPLAVGTGSSIDVCAILVALCGYIHVVSIYVNSSPASALLEYAEGLSDC